MGLQGTNSPHIDVALASDVTAFHRIDRFNRAI